MTFGQRWWRRRAGTQGVAQTLLTLGLFLVLLALWGTWASYSRVEQTRATVAATLTHGLTLGLVVPVDQGGGYESTPYGGGGVPQVSVPGVVQAAATLAQETVPHSQVVVGSTGLTWSLSSTDARRWDLAGPITVSRVMLTPDAPYALTAQVSAPMRVNLWGVLAIPVTLHEDLSVPVAGQQGPSQFQSY